MFSLSLFFCCKDHGFEPSQCHPRAVAALRAASEWGHPGSAAPRVGAARILLPLPKNDHTWRCGHFLVPKEILSAGVK